MKIEEVPYNAVIEARKKKRFTKFADMYDKIKEMEPGTSLSIIIPKEEFHSTYQSVRRITQKNGGADAYEIDQIKADCTIYVSKKLKGRGDGKKLKKS